VVKQLISFVLILTLAACSAPDQTEKATRIAGSEIVRNGLSTTSEPFHTISYSAGLTADYVLVDKSDRLLIAYRQGKPIKAYRGLQFGDAPMGHKQFEGDERTPEGLYTIDWRNPNSSYHLSLHISYPNSEDRAFAARFGRSPGGAIFIHGQPNGLSSGRMRGDWTDGCIALSNAEIRELWQIVPNGTPIKIRP